MNRSFGPFCRVLLLLLAAALFPAGAAAHAAASSAGRAEDTAAQEIAEEEPDVKRIVLGHVGDSYEWHIATAGGREWSLPLPVIVHSPSSGWHCFSAKRLRGGAEYEGLRIAADGDHAGKIVERQADGSDLRPLDLSITKTVAGLLLNSALVVALVLGAARWYRGRKPDAAAPRGVVGLFETLVESLVDDLIEPCVGPSYRRFAPYLLTVFCFIFLNNLMGLIPFFPGGANVTGNIAVALVLAVATFLVVNLSGSRRYWKDIFWPDVPTWLKVPVPIIPLIELVGVFTKPFALMIRLFANMLAGHAVILSLTCVVFVTVKMGAAVNASMTALSVLFSIFMNCLELLVAFLQAYVFTMLSAVFIGLAQERGGEADAGAEK
ncbi:MULTISPECIES: F0F1 ATP synthase subunit A [Alistipes]|uniref:F0F1 ATP synthase subunit A n=1 Tax=Alistipes TaxID=239759 RepID=UPI001B367D6D|nr:MULTISPECIES: F0F1 ATP synthase subunit A [Alistipes]MBQ4903610.1 F0F1 ATP synthase subunit A [Alistipes sp. Marseille-P2263]MCI2259366.1 F0F1 ATP synthase subunit A [Alistipes dispar]